MILRVHLFVLIGLLVLGFALGLSFYPFLPARVPIHWNINGQVDGYGPRWIMAFLMPIILAINTLLFVVLPYLGTIRVNFPQYARWYGRIAIVVCAGMLAIHIALLLVVMGQPLAVVRVVPILTGIEIAVVGNWLGKIRRNSVLGIRTPWTLADDTVWERTHRIGAPLMVVYGLAIALAGIFANPITGFIVIIAGALGLVAWAMIYSRSIHQRLHGKSV